MTQMEQTAGRLLRNAGSWYEHTWVYHGYTQKGEVLGKQLVQDHLIIFL